MKKIIIDIITQIKDGRIGTEPSITDRFMQKLQDIGQIEEQLDNIYFKFTVEVRTFRDRGGNSPESNYGADVCLIVNFRDVNKKEEFTKGLLIQSKIHEYPIKIVKYSNPYLHIQKYNKKFEEIKAQCQKMKKITPDSYLLVYNTSGFYTIPVDQIINPPKDSIKISLKAWSFEDFFIRIIKCLNGDIALTEWSDDFLERLIQKNLAPYFLLIKIIQAKGLFYRG